MINQDKPNVNIPETYLNVGSGFNLLVGGVYRLIVGALGASGMANIAKVSFAELWSTITTTWTSETRTWDDCASIIDNAAKPTTSITNLSKP